MTDSKGAPSASMAFINQHSIIELGIGISALLYFLLLNVFVLMRPLISFEALVPRNAVIFLISFLLLFPASFFMGGTLPILIRFLVHRRGELGDKLSRLYAINTFGAVIGTLTGGFVLLPLFGVWHSQLLTTWHPVRDPWHRHRQIRRLSLSDRGHRS